ncbi:MAG: acetylglutamate kinase [Candidatus Omnitrophica bacterium]|nr:acetylglutamate kinase [Candidatus Omnitrophota bacterium]MCM8810466.1 acetylglutamate kinase [Candidatus Omnitrophota bacterium]
MDNDYLKKADIFVEAFKYIKEFKNKIFVIKLGGSVYQIEDSKENILFDIALLSLLNIKIIIICGGGKFINDEIEKKGAKSKFIDGLRVTDLQTLNIVKDVLFNIRDNIVKFLKEKFESNVDKLTPEEKFVIASKIHYQKGEEIIDLGFVGQMKKTNVEYIKNKLNEKDILVCAPLAFGEDENLYNINGDTFASFIASSLKSEKLIFITDVLGIMRNPENPETLISKLTISQGEELIKEQVIKGGMIPKVKAGINGIKNGVKTVHVISGNLPHSLLLEVLTEHGVGSEIIENG